MLPRKTIESINFPKKHKVPDTCQIQDFSPKNTTEKLCTNLGLKGSILFSLAQTKFSVI